MPGTTVDVSTGITIVFGTSGFTAEITDVSWGGISRESVATSHMGTAAPGVGNFGNMTFIPGDLSDPGEITFEIHFNPEDEPPIDQPEETITITWPLAAGDATPADWEGTGFNTGFDIGAPLDDKMTGSLTVKMSGEQAITGAV